MPNTRSMAVFPIYRKGWIYQVIASLGGALGEQAFPGPETERPVERAHVTGRRSKDPRISGKGARSSGTSLEHLSAIPRQTPEDSLEGVVAQERHGAIEFDVGVCQDGNLPGRDIGVRVLEVLPD